MDPEADQDPAIFIIDLQDDKKKLIFLKPFFLHITNFLMENLHHFRNIKCQTEYTKQ
jgi:hypothetical protein